MEAGALLGCGDEGVFERAPGLVHLAAGDFGLGCADETEFADGEGCGFVAYGWAEGAALHRAGGVEVAGAGDGVEDGAGLVVGEGVEGGFVVGLGEEEAGGGVAGEVACEAGARGCGAGADAGCGGGVGLIDGGAKGFGVELRDGEDADAALVTAGLAGEPVAGAGGGGG